MYSKYPKQHNKCDPLPEAAICSFRYSGFTLIELLIVVAIISILATMAMFHMQKASDRAKTVQCMGNMRALGTALSTYYLDHNQYPPADGNADEWNSHDQASVYGNGPAAGGYWDGIPHLLIDQHYVTDESIMYCPVLAKMAEGDEKKYFRYAYNMAASEHSGSVVFQKESGENYWILKCLHLDNSYFPPGTEFPDYPHAYYDKNGENVLYSNGTVVFEER